MNNGSPQGEAVGGFWFIAPLNRRLLVSAIQERIVWSIFHLYRKFGLLTGSFLLT